ncbi:MAG: metallophosphoesterase [Lentisphaeria bacterium]|nr:metallophosphoesterase [Lentisphaeria bacterium]
MDRKYPEEIHISSWCVSFGDEYTLQDALSSSKTGVLPGKTYSFTLKNGETADLDDLRNFKAPIKSGALMLCTIRAEHAGTYTFSVAVDWWFTGFINGKTAVDLGVHGNNGAVAPLSHLFRMELNEGDNTFAALTNRGGATWDFTFMPVTENILSNVGPVLSTRYYKNALRKNREMACTPWCFTPSVHSMKVGAIFYSEVICGIRYRKAGSSEKWTEKWTCVCGQKTPRENHIFELDSLEENTLYEFQILRLNELAPAIEIVFKNSFRTFPEKGVEHSFYALSDLQTNEYERSRLVAEKFLRNCNTENTEFMAFLGDMDSDCTDFVAAFFGSCFDLLKKSGPCQPLAIIRGNHELRGESQCFPRYFGRTYGSFRRGDVFYFMLDTGEDKPMHAAMPHLYTVRTDLDDYLREQGEWLMREIETEECKNAKYHIVLAHAAPFQWIAPYYAEKIASFLQKAFYGKNPKCKLDLWLCGDVHCPFRFDPVSGEVWGALNKEKKFARQYAMGEFDRDNICFPVYINSGPSCSTVDFSLTRADIREKEIELTMQDPEGTVLDHVILHKGGGMTVKSTTFFRYPLQKELEAKGIDTPIRPVTPEIGWETIPFTEVLK